MVETARNGAKQASADEAITAAVVVEAARDESQAAEEGTAAALPATTTTQDQDAERSIQQMVESIEEGEESGQPEEVVDGLRRTGRKRRRTERGEVCMGKEVICVKYL